MIVDYLMVSFISIEDKFISVYSKVRPVLLKQTFFRLIYFLYLRLSRLKSILIQLRLPVCIVTGIEKKSGEKIRLLFASCDDFPLFLSDLVFSKEPVIQQVGHVFIWNLNNLNSNSFDEDVILVSCDQFFRRFLHHNDFFVFPHMVDMVLDCSHGIDKIFHNLSSDAKREIKKVQNQDFSFEITSDNKKLSMFYYDMYVPMVENRFGKTDMFIPDFLTLQFFLEMGFELMLTLLDGEYVCGSFFYHKKKVLEVKYSGISHADMDLYRKRVSAADQYYIIFVALERKVTYLDYGGARPFFKDGLFYYKQKWGTTVQPYSLVPDCFGLKIINDKVMKPFLLNNPFIGISKDDRFVSHVFVDKNRFSEKEKRDIEKRFLKPGIDEVRFIEM